MTLKQKLSASYRKETEEFSSRCRVLADRIMEELIKPLFIQQHEEAKRNPNLCLQIDISDPDCFKIVVSSMPHETRLISYKFLGLKDKADEHQEIIKATWELISVQAIDEGIDFDKERNVITLTMDLENP